MNDRVWILLARAGAMLWLCAMLAGASLIGPMHVGGAGLLAVGLGGAAQRGRLADALAPPGPWTFYGLWTLTALGHLALIAAAWDSLAFTQGDTGIFAGRVAAFAQRGEFWCSEIQKNAFADHIWPVMFAFVPLYWLSPTFLWLPLAKAAAFLAAPLVLVRLSRALLGPDSRLIWTLPSLALVHAPLTLSAVFDFQPNQLAPPFVVLAFLFAHQRRPAALALTLALTATLKEDLPLAWMCLGLWMVLERDDRRGYALAGFAIAFGLALYAVVMPLMNSGDGFHAQRFGPLENLALKAGSLGLALAAVGGLPLVRPRTLAWALPAFAVNLLSATEAMNHFRYHYFVVPHTVMLIAALQALVDVERGTSLLDRMPARWRERALAAGLALAAGVNGMLPHRAIWFRLPTPVLRAIRRELATLAPRLPAEPVLAGHQVSVHLHERGVRHLTPERLNQLARPHVVVMTIAPLSNDLPAEHDATLARLRREVARGRTAVLSESSHLVVFRRLPP